MPVAQIDRVDQVVTILSTRNDAEASIVKHSADSEGFRLLIRREFLPQIDLFSAEVKAEFKAALQYLLTINSPLLDTFLDEQLEWPGPLPDDTRAFYLWLWDGLYPNESWKLEDISEWTMTSKQRTLKK